jgi:hypothetical protein
VAFSSSLDNDSQGAQFLAPRIPNRALSKRGPCYACPDVHVANGSTGRGAVLLPPGQSTKHPSLLSCRYFLTPLNTRDSINCFKRALSLSLSLLHSRCRRRTQLKNFSSGPVNEALRLRQTLSMTTKSKKNFSRERRKITVAPWRYGISRCFNRHLGIIAFLTLHPFM